MYNCYQNLIKIEALNLKIWNRNIFEEIEQSNLKNIATIIPIPSKLACSFHLWSGVHLSSS